MKIFVRMGNTFNYLRNSNIRVTNDIFHTCSLVCSVVCLVSFNCRVLSFELWCFLNIDLSLNHPVFDFSCVAQTSRDVVITVFWDTLCRKLP